MKISKKKIEFPKFPDQNTPLNQTLNSYENFPGKKEVATNITFKNLFEEQIFYEICEWFERNIEVGF